MTQKSPNDDLKFDFTGRRAQAEREYAQGIQQEKFNHFRKLGRNALIVAGLVGVLAGGGYEAHSMYEKHIDNQIATAEQTVKSIDEGAVLGLLNREVTETQRLYSQNQLMITRFGEYKELIDIMDMKDQIASQNTQNARLYKQTMASLNNDSQAIHRAYDTLRTPSRDAKISEYIDGSDMNVLGRWNDAVKANQFVYLVDIQGLNTNLQGQLKNLETTKQEIIENVQQRLKNKDYNLDAAQANFTKQIADDSNQEISDLKEAQDEIKDAQAARQDNDESADQNMNNLLTDNDVSNAQDAVGQIQQAAYSQLKDDRSKVDSLIAQASQSVDTPASQVAATTPTNIDFGNQPQNQANVAPAQGSAPVIVNNYQSSPHMSFFDYYLLYNWMNSPTTTVYNTTYVNSGYTAPAATRTYKTPINVAKSPLYNVANEHSYINKTLSANSSLKVGSAMQSLNKANGSIGMTRPNITALRSQIDSAKAKASQARSWRSAEFSRMGIETKGSSGGYKAGGYKGGSYRSSPAHFSASHGEGGHGGGFGHAGGGHSSGG
jgi:hypothetical protein